MTYQCPKGHQSTDSDYCSECGALIGQSNIEKVEAVQGANGNNGNNGNSVSTGTGEICPDCGTPRTLSARFCEVCRHDFQENKTGVAEAIVASQKVTKQPEKVIEPLKTETPTDTSASTAPKVLKAQQIIEKDKFVVAQKLNVLITVDRDKVSSCEIETAIKPDTIERSFPLDLDENLVGRRSASKGVYPEIEINDPGVSHRHLKFIKQPDGTFAVLELGSSNGTELNGVQLQSGVNTAIKAGDLLTLGIWTELKIVSR